MEIGGKSCDGKVCHTCGHLGIPAAIITCSLCKMSTIHTYCMRLVPPEVPEVWQCDDCLLNSGIVSDKREPIKQEESFSIIGSNFGKHEKQKSLQINCSRKIEAGKVKFISTKEVTGLTLGIRSVRRGSCWARHLMRGKSIPTLRETVPPTSLNSKELSVSFRLKKKASHAFAELRPSTDKMVNKYVNQKRGIEAFAEICRKKPVEGKPGADAYNCSLKCIQFKPPLKLQDGCGFMKGHPNASLAVMKEKKFNEKIVVANVSPLHNSGIVISSILQCDKISDQEMSHPLKIMFSSDEKHQYALEVCWRGVFEVVDMFSQVHGGVCAHFASQVSRKVYDFSKQLPRTLKFKILPRESVWPKIFKLQSPTKDDIALYFMCEVERHKEKYNHFVQHINSHDYALKSCIADVKLLLFTSARLQTDSQKFGGSIYFWGVFHHMKLANTIKGEQKANSCVPSVAIMNDKRKHSESHGGCSEEVDMEIDTLGGHHAGVTDKPAKLDVQPGIPKAMHRSRVSFLLNRPTNTVVLDVPPGFPMPMYKPKT